MGTRGAGIFGVDEVEGSEAGTEKCTSSRECAGRNLHANTKAERSVAFL